MVTITGYNLRTQKEGDKKQYITLEIEGDVEMVQSQNTGRFYATVRRCVISSTFDELTAERMVGKQMPGTIERVPCEAYDFTIKDTAEVIKLGYRWDYKPEGGRRVYATKQRATDLSKPFAEIPAEEEDTLQETTTEGVVTH